MRFVGKTHPIGRNNNLIIYIASIIINVTLERFIRRYRLHIAGPWSVVTKWLHIRPVDNEKKK